MSHCISALFIYIFVPDSIQESRSRIGTNPYGANLRLSVYVMLRATDPIGSPILHLIRMPSLWDSPMLWA